MESLGKLLAEYRPFAGQYDEWNKCIKLNDKGVSMQVFEDDEYDLERAISEHYSESFSPRFIDYSSSIIATRLLGAPLMTVRLTHLKNGGCVLGVCANHGLCDGDTFYSMMDRWAALARGTDLPPTVVIDQSQVPFDPKRRTLAETKQAVEDQGWTWVSLPPAGLRLARIATTEGILLHDQHRSKPFHISNKALKRMKLAAELDAKYGGRQLKGPLTSNEVVSSFMCQMNAKILGFADNTPCGHSTMFNWRGRLKGLSPHFAGNASSAIGTCEFFAGSPLGHIAAAMNRGLDAFKTDADMVEEHCKLFLDCHHHGLIAHMSDPRSLPYLNPIPTSSVTNNFARYPIYNVDFGTGKPDLVVPHHCGDQVIIWPRLDGDGVDVYFQGTTAKRVNAFTDPAEVAWLEAEMTKYETVLDEDSIRAWFDFRMSPTACAKDLQIKSDSLWTLNPVVVGRKPVSRNTSLWSAVMGFVMDSFVRPTAAILEQS